MWWYDIFYNIVYANWVIYYLFIIVEVDFKTIIFLIVYLQYGIHFHYIIILYYNILYNANIHKRFLIKNTINIVLYLNQIKFKYDQTFKVWNVKKQNRNSPIKSNIII